MRTRLTYSLAAALAILLAACQAGPTSPTISTTTDTSGNRLDCLTEFDADTDYFPEKAQFTVASGVSVEYHKSYKIVTVDEPSPGAAAESYVLLQCGAPKPTLAGQLADAPIIEVPVQRIAASSTTQVVPLELLEATAQVVGVATPELLFDGPIKSAADAGHISGFVNPDYTVNVEQVVALQPDVLLTAGWEEAAYPTLRESGIAVVGDASWLDTSPLGRAEWLKLPALFLNREAAATELFAGIEADYREVAEAAAQVTQRPTTLLGNQINGVWYVPGADSYQAALIADAGAEYVFATRPGTGSEEVGLEEVLAGGATAQFWLGGDASGGWATIADVTAADPRYAELAAVQAGNVWNPTARINEAGGNDYWQQGAVRPDLVLADLVAIFHPELRPGHEFTFYEKVQ